MAAPQQHTPSERVQRRRRLQECLRLRRSIFHLLPQLHVGYFHAHVPILAAQAGPIQDLFKQPQLRCRLNGREPGGARPHHGGPALRQGLARQVSLHEDRRFNVEPHGRSSSAAAPHSTVGAGAAAAVLRCSAAVPAGLHPAAPLTCPPRPAPWRCAASLRAAGLPTGRAAPSTAPLLT